MRFCLLSQVIVFVGCAYLHTHKQSVGLHTYEYLQYLTLCTVYSIYMASISVDLHYYGFTLVISCVRVDRGSAKVHVLFPEYLRLRGTAVAQWVRCCVTNRKVAGSIPDGVIGILHWHPSDRTMALGSTQLLTEMSTRRISWGGKCGRCVRLTTLPLPCAVVMKSGNLNFLETSGPIQVCNGTDAAAFYLRLSILPNFFWIQSAFSALQIS